MKRTPPSHEIIIEYVSHGNVIKVSAIDPATGIEASIVGDPALAQEQLAQLAIRKLKYVMRKKQKK